MYSKGHYPEKIYKNMQQIPIKNILCNTGCATGNEIESNLEERVKE